MKEKIEERVDKLEKDVEEIKQKIDYKEEGSLIVCSKCKYTWMTKSKLYFISCPSCGSKNRIKEEQKGEDKPSPEALKKPKWTKDYVEGKDPFDIIKL